MTIRSLLTRLSGWVGSREFYAVVGMFAFAGGFWLSVLAGPGWLFGPADYPEPRLPGIVTVTVTVSPPATATTPTTDVPVAGERAGTGRRSNPAVTSRRSGAPTTTEVPADSKGQATVVQSPRPGPSSTTTPTSTTTSTTPPDDEGDDGDE